MLPNGIDIHHLRSSMCLIQNATSNYCKCYRLYSHRKSSARFVDVRSVDSRAVDPWTGVNLVNSWKSVFRYNNDSVLHFQWKRKTWNNLENKGKCIWSLVDSDLFCCSCDGTYSWIISQGSADIEKIQRTYTYFSRSWSPESVRWALKSIHSDFTLRWCSGKTTIA